jgi:hypothetical protein
MGFHRVLVNREYRRLFTPKRRRTPGPKETSSELIDAVFGMRRQNPRFGYQRIAQQFALALDIEIDKSTVRRVLAKRDRPDPSGPSWSRRALW